MVFIATITVNSRKVNEVNSPYFQYNPNYVNETMTISAELEHNVYFRKVISTIIRHHSPPDDVMIPGHNNGMFYMDPSQYDVISLYIVHLTRQWNL